MTTAAAGAVAKELRTSDEMASRLWRIVCDACDDIATAIGIAAQEPPPPDSASSSELADAWKQHKELEAELITLAQKLEDRAAAATTATATSDADDEEDDPTATATAVAVREDLPTTTAEVEKAFRASTRRLCRAMKEANHQQAHTGGSLSATSKAFLELIAALAEGTWEALSRPLEEDSARRSEHDAAVQELKRAEEARRAKQEALQAAKAEHGKVIEQRAALAQRLRDEIAEVEQSVQAEARTAMNEAKSRDAGDTKAAKDKEVAYQAEREKLLAALEAKAKEHKKKEHELRKRKQRTEQEAGNWIRRYDGEMGELHTAHTGVDAEYSKEKEELEAAEREAARLTAERDELVAEESRRAQA
jgi:hypothetical protein